MDYRVYEGVKKLQRYLNTLSLVPKLTVDGKFGPKTDAAVAAWLGTQPADTQFPDAIQASAGLTDTDVLELRTASQAFWSTGGGIAKTEEGGIPTWGWFLIGLGVLTAGYFGYKYLVKPKSKAAGELDDTGDFGDGGCGCGG